MSDGPFFVDSRSPHISASGAVVTLTATLAALVPVGNYPVLGANYFNYVGKALRIRSAGILNTGATPGSVTYAHLWGTGANNNGAGICSAAMTMTANLVNITYQCEIVIRCRSLGASGSLMSSGFFMAQTFGFVMMPPTGLLVGTFDLTQNWIPSIQVSRSGSTVETVQLTDLLIESLN
jgi:hypothetical protein